MSRSIFRQSALDRLSSPEQLDHLMSVTRPKGWLALAAICAVVVTAVIWSIYGSIPTVVSGSGILIKSGGVFSVQVLGSGVVSEVDIEVGDLIQEGQVIARIMQPQLSQRVKQRREMVQLAEETRERRSAYITSSTAMEREAMDQTRIQRMRDLRVAEERIVWLEQRVTAQEEAVTLGIITRETLQSSIQNLESARRDRANTQLSIQEIDGQKLTLQEQTNQQLEALEEQVLNAKRALQITELEMDQAYQVVSPYTGYIQEITVSEGQIIKTGQSIVSLEMVDAPLQAMAFIPALGSKIQPGMTAQIAPATVKREEHGFMVATVTSVSGLPATQQGMMRILNNEILVTELVSQGAPFTIELKLEIDPETVSGFSWSSGVGPPIAVGSGTICEVRVIVDEQHPISMVIPILKETLGI